MTQLGRLMPPDEFPAAFIAAHRGRDRRSARTIQRSPGPLRDRSTPHRSVGPLVGARLYRAVAWKRRCGAPLPQTLVRPSPYLHARAGSAPGARRPAGGADLAQPARRGGRDSRLLATARRGSRPCMGARDPGAVPWPAPRGAWRR